jgi:hypothetical protein
VSAKVLNTGGGTFDPQEGRIYFIASNAGRLDQGAMVHQHLLIAVNEIEGASELRKVEGWLSDGKKVFLDSGVFNLAMTHARNHNLTMDVALNTPPEEVDGFGKLFERYVTLVRSLQDRIWGYIEIDQGGRENKIKTRAKLEALGLRPIPVYHPLNDGWEYFDYLAERYDRICFGNIVQADRATRLRLLATMWERHRKYPHLWIHILGLTPNGFMNCYPSNSADSSTWMVGLRWADSFKERTMCAPVSEFPLDFRYAYGADKDSEIGGNKATRLAGYWAFMIHANWRNHIDRLEQLGIEVYP